MAYANIEDILAELTYGWENDYMDDDTLEFDDMLDDDLAEIDEEDLDSHIDELMSMM